jgi:hypothetical protein
MHTPPRRAPKSNDVVGGMPPEQVQAVNRKILTYCLVSRQRWILTGRPFYLPYFVPAFVDCDRKEKLKKTSFVKIIPPRLSLIQFIQSIDHY